MRFAVVFAAILPIAFADAVTIDAVIGGADYTLEDILDGTVTGLSDRSINGVSGVALTDDGFLVGLPSYVHATLMDILEGIAGGCTY